MGSLTPIVIDDPADPRIADYVDLTDAELRRPEHGVFIAEGEGTIRRLVASPYPVRSVLLSASRLDRLRDVLPPVPVYVASREVMAAVAGFDIHRGAVASADRLPMPAPAVLLGTRGVDPRTTSARTVMVLEGLNDHENLGAMFRTAAALGVGAALLDPTCADPLYRRSVRVSLGHVLSVPFTVDADPTSTLRSAGFEVIALTPDPDAEPIDDVVPAGPYAVVVGAEGPGLSRTTLAAADRRVRVPMTPSVDSLNVVTAAAIAFHCLRRHAPATSPG